MVVGGVGVGALIRRHEGFETGHYAGRDAVADLELRAGSGGCTVVCWVVRVEHLIEIIQSEADNGDDAGQKQGLVCNMTVG